MKKLLLIFAIVIAKAEAIKKECTGNKEEDAVTRSNAEWLYKKQRLLPDVSENETMCFRVAGPKERNENENEKD